MTVASVGCEVLHASEGAVAAEGGGSASLRAFDPWVGPPSHFVDAETAELRRLGMEFRDAQQIRLMLAQREIDDRIVEEFRLYENRVRERLKSTLRAHPLWPWLRQFPGLGGGNVALLVGLIADPRRFPGQKCTVGHYLPPFYEVGSPCPLTDVSEDLVASDHPRGDAETRNEIERRTGLPEARVESEGSCGDGAVEEDAESDAFLGCPGVMLPPRRGTGVRAVWHYCGLHVGQDGRAPRRQKGKVASWSPQARTAVLMPNFGIAEQIVRLRVPVYRDAYEAAKERLSNERGVTDVAGRDEIDGEAGVRLLRPFEVDHTAKVIAAKRFVGDLLVEWKQTEPGTPL